MKTALSLVFFLLPALLPVYGTGRQLPPVLAALSSPAMAGVAAEPESFPLFRITAGTGGIPAYVFVDRNEPQIQIRLILHSGDRDEQEPGTARVLGEVMMQRVREKVKTQVEMRVDTNAIATTFTFSMWPQDMDATLDSIHYLLSSGGAAQVPVTGEEISRVMSSRDIVSEVTAANLVTRSRDGAATIDAEAIRASASGYVRDWYNAANAALVVSGMMPSDDMGKLFAAKFSGLERSKLPERIWKNMRGIPPGTEAVLSARSDRRIIPHIIYEKVVSSGTRDPGFLATGNVVAEIVASHLNDGLIRYLRRNIGRVSGFSATVTPVTGEMVQLRVEFDIHNMQANPGEISSAIDSYFAMRGRQGVKSGTVDAIHVRSKAASSARALFVHAAADELARVLVAGEAETWEKWYEQSSVVNAGDIMRYFRSMTEPAAVIKIISVPPERPAEGG